jgi:hypothetical protein
MQMLLKSLPCALPCLLLLVSCRSPANNDALSTPSGRPEVVIQTLNPAPIRNAARKLFIGRGYVETATASPYELVFDRPVKPTGATRALRVRLRLIDRGGGTWRLSGVSMRVDQWRSELESEDVNSEGYPQIQVFLESIRTEVENTKPDDA